MVFSLLAVGSINESLLGNYISTVVELLLMGARTNNVNLIQRCGSIILWMSRDRIIVEMVHSPRFQDLLQKSLESLVESLEESKHTGTTNSILTFLVKILRTNFIANKKFTETFIPPLTSLLKNPKIANGLLELLTDLVIIFVLPIIDYFCFLSFLFNSVYMLVLFIMESGNYNFVN